MERVYTINIYKEWKKVPIWKRTKKSIKAIKEFLARHMKTKPENIKIDIWLNMEIWKNSIKNPPRKIKIRAIKDEKGIVKVELFEKPKRALKLERKKQKEVSKKESREKKQEEKEVEKKEDREKEKEENKKESKDNK